MEKYTVVHLTLLIFSLGFTPILLKEFQLLYYKYFDKMFFVHFYLKKKKLKKKEIDFLYKNVNFYRKLNLKEKKYFEHRIAVFLSNTHFINRSIDISQEMKLLVSSTITTLTFGFSNFKLTILKNVVIYPDQYRSSSSGKVHKGEFNPKLKTLVFSWKDFLLGFDSLNDNINLGIHEFTHALHANSMMENNINSIIFKKEYKILLNLIRSDQKLKSRIIKSKYFREYAFNNQYELLAVFFEHFIETPKDLKANFPDIYFSIKKMLNFNFGNY